MYPVLFRFHWLGYPVSIGSYRFFLVVAAAAGVGLAWFVARRRGMPSLQALILPLSVVVAMPVGARLLHLATNHRLYLREPGRLFAFQATGFALFGGLISTVLVGVLVCRWFKIDLWRAADSAAPALGISLALVRVGCFLDGCCPGAPSFLPWAVSFPGSATADLVRGAGALPILGGALRDIAARQSTMHPVDIYELIAALIGVAAAVWLLRRRAPDGTAFLVFALWYSGFRLINHTFRVPADSFSGPAWFYPAVYVAAMVLTVVVIMWRRTGLRADLATRGPGEWA